MKVFPQLPVVLFLLLIVFSGCASELVTDEDGLWLSKGTGAKTKLAHFGDFLSSERGKTLAFTCFFNDVPEMRLWLSDKSGELLQDYSFYHEDMKFIRFIQDCGWVEDNLFYVTGSVNPSLSIYFEFNTSTNTVVSHHGSIFSHSPSNNFFVIIVEPPHFNSPDNLPSYLMINGEIAGTIPNGGVSSFSGHLLTMIS